MAKIAVPKRWFLCSGPDSRHLHDAQMFMTLTEARNEYSFCVAKAKQLVSIEYPHKMSEGENRKILKEQIA
jgi:hypothetical protein